MISKTTLLLSARFKNENTRFAMMPLDIFKIIYKKVAEYDKKIKRANQILELVNNIDILFNAYYVRKMYKTTYFLKDIRLNKDEAYLIFCAYIFNNKSEIGNKSLSVQGHYFAQKLFSISEDFPIFEDFLDLGNDILNYKGNFTKEKICELEYSSGVSIIDSERGICYHILRNMCCSYRVIEEKYVKDPLFNEN